MSATNSSAFTMLHGKRRLTDVPSRPGRTGGASMPLWPETWEWWDEMKMGLVARDGGATADESGVDQSLTG